MIILMPEAPDSPLYPQGYAELDEAARAEALSGIGSILRSVAPFFLLCDRLYIGFAPRVRDPHFGCPALYVFDSAPGGSGLSEALSLRLPEVFAAASERARTCGCDSGCPSCIGVLATGAEVKSAAVSLLAALSGS